MLLETINLSRNCCKKNAGKYLELNAYHKRGKPNACLTDSIALSMTNCILLKIATLLVAIFTNIFFPIATLESINHSLSALINLFLSYVIYFTQTWHYF